MMKTIGHSTRSLEEFVKLLEVYGVTQIVDIRKMPRSRANPQFNYETLPGELRAHGIAYAHMPGLTGLRKGTKTLVKTAWRNKSFQAFAEYMQTPEFDESIDELEALSKARVTAIMCAEAVPWRCHRSLVADALLARGIAVDDLMSETKCQAHVMPDFARIRGTKVTYPLPT